MKVIGVDLGGSKVEAALIDNGVIKNLSRTETMAFTNKYRILQNILHCIEEVFMNDVRGIGVGIPGVADNSGKLLFMANIPKIEGVNLRDVIGDKFRKPVFIDNDAKCFTLAEYFYGAGKGYKNVVGLVIGTGIGAGLILDGKLYRGSDGGAGEVGHNLLFTGKNKLVEFEDLCSASAILKKQKKLSNNLGKDFYKYLAVNIANIINTFNPEIIVVGGGLSGFLDYRLLNNEVKKYAIPLHVNKAIVVKSFLDGSAGLLGAASLVSSFKTQNNFGLSLFR